MASYSYIASTISCEDLLLGIHVHNTPIRNTWIAFTQNLCRLRAMLWNIGIVLVSFEQSHLNGEHQKVQFKEERSRANQAVDRITENDVVVEMGLSAQYELLLIGVWSAIEVLLEDTWHEVLNGAESRNQSLAQWEEKFVGKVPSLAESFQSEAFTTLKRLKVLRNLLVHKGGVVDQRYVDLCAKLGRPCEDEIGKRLSLSDRKVVEFFNAGVWIGSEIVLKTGEHLKMP